MMMTLPSSNTSLSNHHNLVSCNASTTTSSISIDIDIIKPTAQRTSSRRRRATFPITITNRPLIATKRSYADIIGYDNEDTSSNTIDSQDNHLGDCTRHTIDNRQCGMETCRWIPIVEEVEEEESVCQVGLPKRYLKEKNAIATPSSSYTHAQLQSSAISDILEDLETLENDQYSSGDLEYEEMDEDTDEDMDMPQERRPRAVSIIEEDSQNIGYTKRGVVDSRHVSFIDEVISGCHLVTGTIYRPTTIQDEKTTLYYTSKDYQNFALEEYYEREELKVFSWEDFMVCDDDSTEMNSKEEEEERQDTLHKEEGSIHKVETLENLCYSSDTDVRSY